jgi:hypothetical protein
MGMLLGIFLSQSTWHIALVSKRSCNGKSPPTYGLLKNYYTALTSRVSYARRDFHNSQVINPLPSHIGQHHFPKILDVKPAKAGSITSPIERFLDSNEQMGLYIRTHALHAGSGLYGTIEEWYVGHSMRRFSGTFAF